MWAHLNQFLPSNQIEPELHHHVQTVLHIANMSLNLEGQVLRTLHILQDLLQQFQKKKLHKKGTQSSSLGRPFGKLHK